MLSIVFIFVSAITKGPELGMFHWAKIDGQDKTLYVLLNPKRYSSNTTQIFKEEMRDVSYSLFDMSTAQVFLRSRYQ